jgi:hypothetical protein
MGIKVSIILSTFGASPAKTKGEPKARIIKIAGTDRMILNIACLLA